MIVLLLQDTAGYGPPRNTATLPRYRDPLAEIIPPDICMRDRSHSHCEEHCRRILQQNRISSPNSSGYSSMASSIAQVDNVTQGHSSGYSSMASSVVQVDTVTESQESLDEGEKLAMSTHSYRFPTQPAPPCRSRRGGSLTTQMLFSTGSRGPVPHHFRSRHMDRSHTD